MKEEIGLDMRVTAPGAKKVVKKGKPLEGEVPSKPEQAVSTLLILAASLIMRIILLVSGSLEDVDTGQQADRESCINQVSGEGVDLGEDRGGE